MINLIAKECDPFCEEIKLPEQKDFRLKAKYVGNNPRLKGLKGFAYFSAKENKWAFDAPDGETYYVQERNLHIY